MPFDTPEILRGHLGPELADAAPTEFARTTSKAHKAFLRFLDAARVSLGFDLLKNNARPGLSNSDALNEITRHLLVRLIAPRVSEDRGIPTGTVLRAFFHQSHRLTHTQLAACIRQLRNEPSANHALFANALFDEGPTKQLHISTDWLAAFAKQLSAPDIHFATASARDDILGVIYEHTLRTPLTVSPGGTVTLLKKSSGRKTRGVYYTPGYIADHMIEQTVARVLDGKTPSEVSRFRFLDPACGSGAFLIPLYARVLEHCRRWFHAHGDRRASSSRDFYFDASGKPRLTRALRSRLLQDNIYGVDLDPRAVEITRFSLHLKLLADELRDTNGTLSSPQADELSALPSLEKNILCGNSLIAPDFSADPAERARVNAFDWNRHFAPIIATGGFDAVIGNPPYVAGEFLDDASLQYFKRHYCTARRQIDLYHLFFERSLQLTKKSGHHACIVPDAILARDETAFVRRMLVDHHALTSIAHVGAVFPGAGVSAAILCSQALTRSGREVSVYQLSPTQPPTILHALDLAQITRDPDAKLLTGNSPRDTALLEKICAQPLRLGALCRFSRGEELGKKQLVAARVLDPDHEWIRVGADVSRYYLESPCYQVPRSAIKKHRRLYTGPKLLIVKTGHRPHAAWDIDDTATLQSLYNVHAHKGAPDLRVILALLNSALVSWYLRKTVTSGKKLFPQFNQNHFEQLPVPTCPDEVAQQLILLVEEMLTLTHAAANTRSASEPATLQRTLGNTDRTIDQLVYKLYGFTSEEIAVIEEPEN